MAVPTKKTDQNHMLDRRLQLVGPSPYFKHLSNLISSNSRFLHSKTSKLSVLRCLIHVPMEEKLNWKQSLTPGVANVRNAVAKRLDIWKVIS